jgi:ABC-type uncharacterized transport system fused permease/ATPase subunit
VDFTLSISIGILNSIVTLCSFIVILWTLSARAPLHVFGASFDIPGYLVWAALIAANQAWAVFVNAGASLWRASKGLEGFKKYATSFDRCSP